MNLELKSKFTLNVDGSCRHAVDKKSSESSVCSVCLVIKRSWVRIPLGAGLSLFMSSMNLALEKVPHVGAIFEPKMDIYDI